ncbi:uncharacterized protein LOC144108666 [Amblyomma americanum]
MGVPLKTTRTQHCTLEHRLLTTREEGSWCGTMSTLEPETCSTAEPLSRHLSDEQDEESAAADDHLPINIATEDVSHRREGAESLVDGCLACGCRCKITETTEKGTQVEPAAAHDHLSVKSSI